MSLTTNYTFVGQGNWSIDGVGGQATGGGIVTAIVPEGSTIEQAFLYSTTYGGGSISSVDLTLGSESFTATGFDALGVNNALQGFRTDVTSFIDTVIDDGDDNPFDFTVSNISGSGVDGFALVVVYSNPDESTRTISLLDGFSASSGDDFTLTFSEPVDTTQTGFEALMSLGIGFSYYPSSQFSRVTIDGRQLTTSAGAQDDGTPDFQSVGNGGLITIGGIGDDPANPDPDQAINNIRTDDELYDLAQGNVDDPAPYLANGATSIFVETLNPSSDDNIFFAGFNITAVVAVDTDENDAPIAVDDMVVTDEASSLLITPLLNDFDPDAADVISITSFDTTGLVGTLTDNGDGTFTYDPDGNFDALGLGDTAMTSFSYTISDGDKSDTGVVKITINGLGDGPPPPPPPVDCPTVDRPGTVDGSASTSDVLVGPAYHNTFYFDVDADSGKDTISNFAKDDILAVSEKLFDGNGDNIIMFGKNGVLDLDGLGGSSDTVALTGVSGLRYLGESCTDVFVYADKDVRPTGAIEGFVSDDVLAGDAADGQEDVFFYDTALDIWLGDDQIEDFGAGDKLVTTSALFDFDGNGIIGFGANEKLDLSGGMGGPGDPGLPGEVGMISMSDTSGNMITELYFAGSETVGDVTYYTYMLNAPEELLAA